MNGEPAERQMNMLARRSRHVLDSMNTEPATTVGGVVKVPVTLATGAASFTWGPGGDVDRPPLSDIRAWAYEDAGGLERWRGPSAVLNAPQWSAIQDQYSQPRDTPLWLWWPRTLEDGRYTIHVAPAVSRPTRLFVYADVPRIVEVERGADGRQYELDPGVASYLIYKLAIDAAPVLDLPLPPEVYSGALAAAERVGQFNRESAALQAAPEWLIGHYYSRRKPRFRS